MKLKSPEYRIVLGTLGWLTLLFMAVMNMVTGKVPDSTIVTTLGVSSTALLGIGIIKQHKNFREDV